ncbi:IS5/IS1182 family transposase, partial [Streptomyces sp. C10-9-1]|nr:IS5/IS1182 family transposase [Streptomyces sp. C10-9-1]
HCAVPDEAGQARNRLKLGSRGRRTSIRSTTANATRSGAGSTGSRDIVLSPTRYDELAVRYEASVLIAALNERL